MSKKSASLNILPCLDSSEIAKLRQSELNISRPIAISLGLSSVNACNVGYYTNRLGQKVEMGHLVKEARSNKKSLPPNALLPNVENKKHPKTDVQVCNQTTLLASHNLVQDGLCPIALNFANGIAPGGGFLHGAKAQEEVLCRSSALYSTLLDDPMYDYHSKRPLQDSSDWVIYSPKVPVFRSDNGLEYDEPWLLSFLTCAAPYAPTVPNAADLLQKRIHRVLSVATVYGYETLVLGAWGCGAFENDPTRTAKDFREALETKFSGYFSKVVFAITDWSPERRFLGPFRDVFND